MVSKSIKGFTPIGQLGILMAFLGAGFVLTAFLQVAIAAMYLPAGSDLAGMEGELGKVMQDPANVNMLRLMQTVGTFFIMLIPALLYAIIAWGKKPFFWLGFNKQISPIQILIAFALIFAANVAAKPLADASKAIAEHLPSLAAMAKKMETTYQDQIMAMSNLKTWPEFLLGVVIMALLPAVFEEVFFRGAMQNIFERIFKNPITAVIVTSLIFSIIHISIYLFLSRAVLGFVLGLLYVYSRNIWVNIIAHFLNNAIAVWQMFEKKLNNKPIMVSDLDADVPLWVSAIAAVAIVAMFFYFRKISADKANTVKLEEARFLTTGNVFSNYSKPM